LIGSGARKDNLPQLLQYAQGIIVGSDLRRDGKAGAPLNTKRVKEFAKAFLAMRKSKAKKPGKKSMSRKAPRKRK
jgi:predicted TIM-barrel enzyme